MLPCYVIFLSTPGKEYEDRRMEEPRTVRRDRKWGIQGAIALRWSVGGRIEAVPNQHYWNSVDDEVSNVTKSAPTECNAWRFKSRNGKTFCILNSKSHLRKCGGPS